jgi:hypothetical protein
LECAKLLRVEDGDGRGGVFDGFKLAGGGGDLAEGDEADLVEEGLLALLDIDVELGGFVAVEADADFAGADGDIGDDGGGEAAGFAVDLDEGFALLGAYEERAGEGAQLGGSLGFLVGFDRDGALDVGAARFAEEEGVATGGASKVQGMVQRGGPVSVSRRTSASGSPVTETWPTMRLRGMERGVREARTRSRGSVSTDS